MRGLPGCNFSAFDSARDLLTSRGHEVVSPADMDREHGVDGWSEVPASFVHDALRRDFAAILTCDAIALLPGWEASQGANAERVVAESIGLSCYRVDAAHFYRESYIGIAGYARAGKDTLAGFIAERGYDHRSFAAPMKSVLSALNPYIGSKERLWDALAWGWDAAKSRAEVRSLLQRLGTTAGRKVFGESFWVDRLFESPSSGRVVISDVRFPNEATAIKDRGGIVVRVTRPGVGPANPHISERALDGFEFDLTVPNAGTIADLEPWADKVLALTTT